MPRGSYNGNEYRAAGSWSFPMFQKTPVSYFREATGSGWNPIIHNIAVSEFALARI